MRSTSHQSLQDKLLETKLEIERAKLDKLRGAHSADGSHVETFLHYEDLPAPSPEDQDRFYVRLASLVNAIEKNEDDDGAPSKRYDVNPMTHNPLTSEAYDYSDVEAKYGPYKRANKEPITVTLKPKG